MMVEHRVFIVGDSLFGESLKKMLVSSGIAIIGAAPTLMKALPLLESEPPDAVIVAEPAETDQTTLAAVRGWCLAVPFIFTSLERNSMQVVSIQRITASPADLLAAVALFGRRHDDGMVHE